MTDAERLTVSLSGEIATTIREAVEAGDYASADDIVRSALQDWTLRRSHRPRAGATLEADIAIGMADVAAGRVTDFDTARIVERGRALSARRRAFGSPLRPKRISPKSGTTSLAWLPKRSPRD